MKSIISLLGVLIIISLIFASCGRNQEMEFPKLSGSYLGQNPPGAQAVMFAHDLLTTGKAEGYIRFSPDGTEMLCGILTDKGAVLVEPMGVFGKGYAMYSRLKDGYWTEPKEFIYPYNFRFSYASFSPSGEKIVFNSYGPGNRDENEPQSRTWYIERENEGWGEPKEIIFGEGYDGPGTVYPSLAANGNLYFAQFHDGVNGYLFVSKYKNGKYTLPERLSDSINDIGGNHPYIAPDESFIIYDSERPDDTYGTSDLYISFRDEEGEWTKPKNLGDGINSQYDERRPFLTYDQKYLFFASDRINPERPDHALTITELQRLTNVPNDSQQHLYWVDAAVINKLRKKNITAGE